jgi:hypothetical protein
MAWRYSTGASRAILAGNFHSVAHKGTGEAQIAERMDGIRELRLIRLKTYPAGDLDVCMVGAPDAADNATVRRVGLLCLGPLDSKRPDSTFSIPASLDLQRYRAVTIWSRSYSVNFTTAALAEQP